MDLRYAFPQERRQFVPPYGKRRKKTLPGVKAPTSPSRRKEPWVTVTLRAVTYAMLRELADFHKITIGNAASQCIEKEFKKLLWEQEQLKKTTMGNVKYVPRA